MRERLKKLLEECLYSPEKTCPRYSEESCDGCQYDSEFDDCDRVGRFADFLLANGVIVPPCPITHDSLFAIVDLYNRKKIVGQTIAKYDIDCIIIGFSGKPIYRCCNASNEWMDFDGDEIGKTVFLTSEEAEAVWRRLQT